MSFGENYISLGDNERYYDGSRGSRGSLILSPRVNFVEVNEDEYRKITRRGKMRLNGMQFCADEIILSCGEKMTTLFVDVEKNVARIRKKKISFWRKFLDQFNRTPKVIYL